MAGQDLAARPRTRERGETLSRRAARPLRPRSRGLRTLPSSASPPQPPDRLERFNRNRPASDRTVEPLPPKRPPLARRSLLRPEPGHVRPGCPPRDASRLPPGAPPSGEGTDTRIERRAPEGVEVVPEALLSSSAATGPLRNRCPPGLSDRRAPNRTSSARRVPGRSFSEGSGTDNNNREVKLKFLLTKFRNLHIRRTKYPLFCPQLLMHSVWISRRDAAHTRIGPCFRGLPARRPDAPQDAGGVVSAALTARWQAV